MDPPKSSHDKHFLNKQTFLALRLRLSLKFVFIFFLGLGSGLVWDFALELSKKSLFIKEMLIMTRVWRAH